MDDIQEHRNGPTATESAPAEAPPAAEQPPQAAAPHTAQTAPEPTADNLDRVRDILFGGQMRMVDSRFQNVEERLLQEQRTLRADFNRQLMDLNAALKAEIDTVHERLTADRAARVEELRALDAEVKEAHRSLEKRHQTLEQAASMADAELRDQLIQHSSAITAEISKLSDRVAGDLDRTVRKIESEKLDRVWMAGLLGEMAHRLGTDSRGGGQG